MQRIIRETGNLTTTLSIHLSLLMFLFKNKHQFPVNTETHHHATRQQSRTLEDKEDDDTDYHKQARALARESVDTADDKYFTV